MTELRDLLGDPILPPRERRGRPEHQATEKNRLYVAGLAAFNRTQEEIAAGLGVSVRTLRKYYLPELKHGAEQFRAAALMKLMELALVENSVPALKELLARVDRIDLPGGRPARKPRPQIRLGKKELAVLEAANPDTTTSMGELLAARGAGTGPH